MPADLETLFMFYGNNFNISSDVNSLQYDVNHKDIVKNQHPMIPALLYPVLFHGLFNFLLMWMSNPEGNNPLLIVLLFVAFFAVVVLLWRAGLRAIRIHSFRDFVDGIKY